MDAALLAKHLAQAASHVAEGEIHLKRQRDLIDQLKRVGNDARVAIDLLATMETTMALHLADRERLRAELATVRGD
jgi:hypothetical protein